MEEKLISKPEDALIRRWIKQEYGLKIPQWELWNLSPDGAVELLKRKSPRIFSRLSAADIERAARRSSKQEG